MRELLRRIDSRELTEWYAFARLEPFGDDWRQTGVLAAVMHNAHSTQKKGAETFMPLEKAEQDGRADYLYFQIFAAQHNAALAAR